MLKNVLPKWGKEDSYCSFRKTRLWPCGDGISTSVRLVSRSLGSSAGVVLVFYTKKSAMEISAGTNTQSCVAGKPLCVQNSVIVISLEVIYLVEESTVQVFIQHLIFLVAGFLNNFRVSLSLPKLVS